MVIVAGEDIESEDEFDRPTALQSMRSQVIVTGEAPESDVDDFGSTVSLGSSSPEPLSSRLHGGGDTNLPLDPKPIQVIVPLHPADILRQREPALYKKHVEKNKSLRNNYVEKALRPSLLQNIKKLDNVSQGISNVQMAMQEALLQSRSITSNLHRMKKELEQFEQTAKEVTSGSGNDNMDTKNQES